MKRITAITLLVITIFGGAIYSMTAQQSNRDIKAYERTAALLGEHLGRPVFIRIIKEALVLELWTQDEEQQWQLMKSYPILAMSGELGPKTKEGDKQAPEGFYEVRRGQLNPNSRFHLAFNIGYPNAYDRSLGRTGSFIMVHGSHYSIGCFAMGDDGIEEIYTMVAQALEQGQVAVPVQIYPFKMTDERMEKEKNHPAFPFWKGYLKEGWDASPL
ncbi:MAG: 2-dehydro-3-deoxyphosphooctonate aldolase [Akkermansia sp.]